MLPQWHQWLSLLPLRPDYRHRRGALGTQFARECPRARNAAILDRPSCKLVEVKVKNTVIVVEHYGGPEELKVVQQECRDPNAGEVRVKVQAAGVSLPDVMAREGAHPETPRVPFTPGWDLVGVVDQVGEGVQGFTPGQVVAAMPIHGAYAEYVCLPAIELVPVPPGLDAAEAVSAVLNYVTAYQMMHRSTRVKAGQRVLIHGAAGGVGTALLQLGRLAGLDMYGTCSAQGTQVVTNLGATPIDYQKVDFITDIRRLTGDGVDVVFESIGGRHIWLSRKALRHGGTVVAYGLTGALRGGRLLTKHPGHRNRLRGLPIFLIYIIGSRLLPGRRRVVPYSIQTLKRLRPVQFREDLGAIFEMLKSGKLKPLVAQRIPLAEARRAHELLGQGNVTGKIVLVCN